jgi:hypothetical protein
LFGQKLLNHLEVIHFGYSSPVLNSRFVTSGYRNRGVGVNCERHRLIRLKTHGDCHIMPFFGLANRS